MITKESLEYLLLNLVGDPLYEDRFSRILDPLLKDLGWDESSRSREGPYSVLSVEKEPVALLIEEPIDRVLSLQYAEEAGIRWAIFTDGDRFEIYSAEQKKLWISIQISDLERQKTTLQVLQLLSKENLFKLNLLFLESQKSEPIAPPRVPETEVDLDTLCEEYKQLSQQIDQLTDRKAELNQQILTQLKEKNTVTTRYKILKYQRVNVKTSLESARALGCTVQIEEVDKEALRRLYDEGLPVPDIGTSECIRISPLNG